MASRTNARGHITSFTYDGLGQAISTTNPLGNRWTYTYDDLGRLVDVRDPMSRDIHSEYDAAGECLLWGSRGRKRDAAIHLRDYHPDD